MNKSRSTGLLCLMFIFLLFSCATKKTPEFYLQKGKTEVIESNAYVAIDNFSKAINLSPNYIEAYEERAMASMSIDSIWNAMSDYDSLLIKVEKNDYKKKGNLYLLKGDAHYLLSEDSLACANYEKSELLNNSKSWTRLRKRCNR